MKKFALQVTSMTAILVLACTTAWAKKKPKPTEPTPLDRYIQEATGRAQAEAGIGRSAGSMWSPSSRFTDLGSDLRARQVDDLVTVLVTERASAVSKGTTKTGRQSSVKSSVSALAGVTRAAGSLSNLAGASTDSQLNGEGSTSRETVLSTTISARVTRVLPNGYLVVEGYKDVQINSEHQMVTVRGVVRPPDLTAANVVRSDQLAQLEVQINGKGVVGDAIRRPFFLYRLLLGILPF